MALLLMVVLVGLSLSALLVPMVISQNRATRFDTTRVQSLGAAQAGVDVALGLIRAAVTVDASGTSYGNSAKLPCGPLSGTVSGGAGATGGGPGGGAGAGPVAAAYSVGIQYFTSAGTAMSCVAGNGVSDPGGVAYSPSIARLTSVGTVGTAVNGSSAGRTLTTTYVFKTPNTIIRGGTIQITPPSATAAAYCLDAGANPSAGTPIVLQTCSTTAPSSPQQTFAYRVDYSLQLLSSVDSSANGLCITAADTPPVAGSAIALGQCSALGNASSAQQWSYTDVAAPTYWPSDNGQYRAALPSSRTTGTLAEVCMNATYPQPPNQPPQQVTLAACGSASAWTPAASVGPGGVAAPQWMNYSEFGRCLYVVGPDPTNSRLTNSPCTQNPFPNKPSWNQKLFTAGIANPPGTSALYATVPTTGTKFCLTSPGVVGGLVSMGVQACASPAGLQAWKINGGDASLSYKNRYTIVDSAGLCLGLAARAVNDTVSTVDVETCTGATDQKWNARSNMLNQPVQNTKDGQTP